MSRSPRFGACHICGAFAKLSFEHVPPAKAFNDKPVVNANIERLIAAKTLTDFDDTRGKTSQRGAGAYTLCDKCNNDSGSWYGSAYVDWVYQGASLLVRSSPTPSLYHIFHIFPLRVLKQIICMFFSANPPTFQRKHPELVRFVLNRREKYLDPSIRVSAFYTISDRSRQSGITAMMELGDDGIGVKRASVYSEIAFPPFGYVLAIGQPFPDGRLVEISHFARYGYDQWTDVSLRLSGLPIASIFPGDYRSREEIMKENSEGQAIGATK